MTERETRLKQYLKNSDIALKQLKVMGFSFLTSDLIWQILIYEFDHHDIPTEVIHDEFSADEIVRVVSAYYHRFGKPIAEIDFPEIIEDNDRSLEKANIKYKGEKWTIHKNDVDPFPSNPHAHQYGTQLKLNLGTGGLYRKSVCLGTISKKDLLNIRTLLNEKIKGLILPKLNV